MSNKNVHFSKYIYWKWSKGDNMHIVKSNRRFKNETNTSSVKYITEEENKREICNNRISQRDPMIQTKTNPYMIKRNYINDIGVRDHFLRPRDSNFKISI